MIIKKLSIIDKNNISFDCSYRISDKDEYGYIIRDIIIDNQAKPDVNVINPVTGDNPTFLYPPDSSDINLMLVNDDCLIKRFLRKVHQIER